MTRKRARSVNQPASAHASRTHINTASTKQHTQPSILYEIAPLTCQAWSACEGSAACKGGSPRRTAAVSAEQTCVGVLVIVIGVCPSVFDLPHTCVSHVCHARACDDNICGPKCAKHQVHVRVCIHVSCVSAARGMCVQTNDLINMALMTHRFPLHGQAQAGAG